MRGFFFAYNFPDMTFQDFSSPESGLLFELFSIQNKVDVNNIFSNRKNIKYMDYEVHHSLKDSENFISIYEDKFVQGEKALWLVYSEENAIVGFIGFGTIDSKHLFASLSVCIVDSKRGQGYGKQILKDFTKHIFESTSLVRIEAQMYVENRKSISLFEKARFTREGCLRKNFLINGDFYDSYIYSILKTEIIP